VTGLVDEIVTEVRQLPEVEEVDSPWGRPAFAVGGREFMHIDRDGLVDVRLTRALIRELDDERFVYRRGSSDWIWLRLESREDARFALELVRRALEVNA
jgi:hypothetical protein